MWISSLSDEINVSADEDVFTIIVTWIDLEKIERKNILPSCFVKFGLFMYQVTSCKVLSRQMTL